LGEILGKLLKQESPRARMPPVRIFFPKLRSKKAPQVSLLKISPLKSSPLDRKLVIVRRTSTAPPLRRCEAVDSLSRLRGAAACPIIFAKAADAVK
jgi:hypothetical protein